MESEIRVHVIKTVCSMCGDKKGKGRHHLIPRQYGGEDTRTIPICKYCHVAIHQRISNRKLLLQYNSLPKLLTYKEKYGLSRLPSIRCRRIEYNISKIEAKNKQKLQKEMERLKEIENEIREEQKLYEAEQILKFMRNGKWKA